MEKELRAIATLIEYYEMHHPASLYLSTLRKILEEMLQRADRIREMFDEVDEGCQGWNPNK